MLTQRPTTFEGIGALAALAWVFVEPGYRNAHDFEEQTQTLGCQAVPAIWKACTGLDSYPVT